MKPRITASIVIYKNEPQILQKAVKSFLDSTTDSIIYLIDNSPSRQFDTMFNNPRIVYQFNNKNIGFGAAHNIALRKILHDKSSDFHLVLNPDVYFAADVVKEIHEFMQENPDVGLAMPKVLYPDGRLQPLCRLLPSPLTLFARRFLRFRSSWINKMNHWYEMHFTGYDKIMDVPFLSGCFMFLKVNALEKVGLFDENIFLYTEDTDLTRRIHQYYRTIYYPQVEIVHYHAGASYKNTVTLLHHIRSAITYFNKWGWFRDTEREFINQKILLKFQR
jgi:GT2 family glycosyltransferase